MKKLLSGLLASITLLAATSVNATDYNSIATAYVTTTISQTVVFDSTMQAGGTFTFSVLAHNGGGRQNQNDTANVKIQFYDSSNTLISSVNTNYSQNLPIPTASSGVNSLGQTLSGNPQADPAVPWTVLSISSTNCGGSCANVAYAKVSMYGVDGSFWAGDYGPWYRIPTLTLNGGNNLLYNPEFGPYNGITAQGWTTSPAFGACQGAWGGSNACIVNAAGVPGQNTPGLVANANGGGPSATGGSLAGTPGGYNSTITSTSIATELSGGSSPAPAPSGPVAVTNAAGTTASNPSGTTTLTVTNAGTYSNAGTTGDVTNTGTFTNTGTTGAVNNSGTFNNNTGGTTGAVTNSGTFTNAGTVSSVADNTGTFTNTGTVTGGVTNHGDFTNSGTTGNVVNAGNFSNSGTVGALSNMGTFSNTGTIASVAYNNATIYNHGTVTGNVANGGHFNNYADGTVGGTVTSTQDTSVYNAGSINSVVLQSNALLANDGTITTVSTEVGTTINNSATGVITNGFTNDGTLNNFGTVADIVNNNAFINVGTAGAVTNNNIFDNRLGGTVASLVNTSVATNAGTITGTVTNSGTFTNSGTTGDWTNDGTMSNSGTMSNGTNNSIFTNDGAVGTVNNTGTFSSNSTGSTGAFTNSGTVSNVGTMASLTNTGTATNYSHGTIGTVTNTSGTFTNLGTTGDWLNNATVDNSGTTGNGTNNGTFTNTGAVGTVVNTGTFTNTGTLVSMNNSGTFTTPSVTLSTYTQTSTGSTVLPYGDKLTVTGAAALDGSLTMTGTAPGEGKYSILSGNGVTGRFSSYTGVGVLKYTANDVEIWVMPDGSIVQAGVNNLANRLSSINSLASGSITGSLGSDCSTFGALGGCVSVNYGNTKVASGDLNSAGLTVAKRISNNWRVGVFAGQQLNSPTVSGIKYDSNTPAVGGFIGWNQNANGQGLGITVSALQGSGNYTIGTDKTGVKGDAAQVKATYTIAVNDTTSVTPYFGVRKTTFKVNGYTENGPLFPLTYAAVNQSTTDAIAGVGVSKQITDKLSGNVSVGVVQNLSYNAGTVNANSDMGNFNAPLQGSKYTSTAFGAGLGYEVAKNQRVGVNFGWQQKSLTNANISSYGVSYTVGF